MADKKTPPKTSDAPSPASEPTAPPAELVTELPPGEKGSLPPHSPDTVPGATTIRAYAAANKLYPHALLPHVRSAGGDIDAFVSPADLEAAAVAMKERI